MPKTKPRLKKELIKKGTPHPIHSSFKFDSAYLKKEEADRAEDRLLATPRVDATRRILLHRQHLVYKRPVRITPKRPKLRR